MRRTTLALLCIVLSVILTYCLCVAVSSAQETPVETSAPVESSPTGVTTTDSTYGSDTATPTATYTEIVTPTTIRQPDTATYTPPYLQNSPSPTSTGETYYQPTPESTPPPPKKETNYNVLIFVGIVVVALAFTGFMLYWLSQREVRNF